MNDTALVFRRCAVRTAAPALLAAAVAAAAAAALGHHEDAAGAALAPWLHLPAFVTTAACCATAVETWPTLSRGRPGVDWVLRATDRPLHGAGAALLGALLALLAWLLPLVAVAALAADAPHAHHRAEPVGPAVLPETATALAFRGPGVSCREIRLRPVALLPSGGAPEPTHVQVEVGGRPLLPEPVAVAGTHQLVRVPVPALELRELAVRRTAGNLPLLFPPGSVELVAQEPASAALNSLLALGCYLLPAAVALALATLAAPAASLPVNLALVLAMLLLQTLGDLGPTGAAVNQMLRGRWLPTEGLFVACLPSLGTGALVMILAMIVRSRTARGTR